MCGITASFLASPIDISTTDKASLESELAASISLLSHRGPDSKGIYISEDGRVGLGHTRLSIIDLEGGQQPLHDADGHVHAVVNGELYDYDRLRQELEARGRTFQTFSDSELVIHLYMIYGFNLVHHLRGEFAFVLYDSRRKVLFAARDLFGIKPLFYTVDNGRLLIASEMKGLLGFGWKAEWDVQSIREGGELNDNRTVFKNVFRLSPAHQLVFSHLGQLKIQPYWDQTYRNSKAVETRSLEDIIVGVRERLVDAVRVRLRSDVPVAVSLSGGIDSGSVAGIASALLKEKDPSAKVVTFTLAFPERGDIDEGPIAQRTGESIGAEIHMITPTEVDLVGKFEESVYHCEMALNTFHAAGKCILSEHVRRAGYKVLLTGEGSDEIQGGYAYFLADYLRAPDPASASLGIPLPSSTERDAALRDIEQRPPAPNHISVGPMSHNDQQFGRSLMGGISTPRLWATTTTPDTLFDPCVLSGLEVADPTVVIAEGLRSEARRNMVNGNWHPLHSALYAIANLMLAMILNELGDRAEMCSSIEGRQPFLDRELVEYMNNIPPSLKIKPYKVEGDSTDKWLFTEKWVLREAVKPYVTEEVYLRKKQQYNSPIAQPNHTKDDSAKKMTPLQVFLKERIKKDSVNALGFLHWEGIERLLDGYLQNAEPGPADGGLNQRSKALLMVASYIILGEKFGAPKAIW